LQAKLISRGTFKLMKLYETPVLNFDCSIQLSACKINVQSRFSKFSSPTHSPAGHAVFVGSRQSECRSKSNPATSHFKLSITATVQHWRLKHKSKLSVCSTCFKVTCFKAYCTELELNPATILDAQCDNNVPVHCSFKPSSRIQAVICQT
jgi:hypothetical protein